MSKKVKNFKVAFMWENCAGGFGFLLEAPILKKRGQYGNFGGDIALAGF